MNRRPATSFFSQSRLRLAAGLMILGVLLQALIPAGFMPSFAKDGKVALVICSGLGEKTVFVDADDYSAPDHQSDNDDNSACPYFLAQTPAQLSSPVIVADAMLPVADLVVFNTSDTLIDQPYLPAPPARGPPAVILS
jgi:hypothetical protein